MIGEVQRVRASQRGHLYFELVEKGAGDTILGRLDAVIWRTAHLRVRRALRTSGQEIRDGLEIRCRCRVDFYPPGGRLQLSVDEIDLAFSLGNLERRRRETLAALAAAGLVERNRELALPPVAMRLGLVTSRDSAAYHDFLATLAESGYAFRVSFVHAAMQGREAEVEVVSALALLGRLDLDAVVLVRGGGARTDLAAFDSRAIAEAIAGSPRPVLTGLGHEIDLSIADLVSHTALKTPTKVAEHLVERVAELDLALAAAGATLARRARRRLGEAGARLEERRERLRLLAPRLLARRRAVPDELGRRLLVAARSRLREARTLIAGLERLAKELAPQRLLERGYSVTRGPGGALLRDPGAVAAGEIVTSHLAGGMLRSRVEER